MHLQLDQVEAGGHLGDRVLDLQPGVDLQEGEQLLLRLVEELDGAGADVAGRLAPAPIDDSRSDRSCSAVSAGELDSSITFWLRRCTEQSRTPGAHTVAVLVGDHLHLDVPAALDQPLHEDDRVAERALGLALRARRAPPPARPRTRTIRMPRPPPPLRALTISG